LSPPDRDLFADLELVDEGAGVPVVFSHGGHSDLSYGSRSGRTSAPATASSRAAVRATGRRSSTPPPFAQSSAALEAGPAHVVGFSTAIALFMSYRAPETFNAVVLDFLAQH
jgi:hypothetical protein